MPVSATATSKVFAVIEADTVMSPSLVNLQALENKLVTICCSLPRSLFMSRMLSLSISSTRRLLFCDNSGDSASQICTKSAAGLNTSGACIFGLNFGEIEDVIDQVRSCLREDNGRQVVVELFAINIDPVAEFV